MGLLEKRSAKRFLEWVGAFKKDNPHAKSLMHPETCSYIRERYHHPALVLQHFCVIDAVK